MTQVIQQVNINLIPQIFGANSVLVPCSQYDKTYRVIQFNVYNGRELYSIPSTCTVIIRGTKKDLTGFEYNCEFSGSQVIFPLEPQITVLSGKVPAELRIVNGEELIGSANFLFMVEPSPLTDDTIISETQLPLLEEALQAAAEAEQSRILAEAAKESAEDYAMSAGESSQSASQSATNASVSEANARTSELNAKASEQNAKESEDLAKGYAEDAQGYASNASDSATSAEASAVRAEEATESAEDYANEAKGYAEQSHTSAQNASQSASNALTSENNAHTSEVNARASEQSAKQSETNASASATSASNSATSASQSASNASQSATQSANSATASANSATASANSATQASQSETSAEESATEAQAILDNIDSLIEHKANDDGIYPNMSVGSAEKLMTSETIDDEFTYQTLKHDGYARINSIKGNTIVWNQIAPAPLFTGSKTKKGITATANSDGSVTFSGTASGVTTEGDRHIYAEASMPVIKDHYYFVKGNSAHFGFSTYSALLAINDYNKNGVIAKASSTGNASFYFRGANYVDGDVINEKLYPQIFDLTTKGLDFLTADQFRSLFPLDFYQFNSGELLSFNGSGIKTAGFNQFDEIFERGYINVNNGSLIDGTYVRSANFIPCMPNTQYYAYAPQLPSSFAMVFYDANQNYVGFLGTSAIRNSVYTTPSNAFYCKFYASEQTDKICINVSNTELNGTYKPYISNTLSLPIQEYFPNGMRSAGNVFDELTEKKAITRIGVIDLGYINWTMYNHSSLGTYFYASVSSYNVKFAGAFIFTAYPATCVKYTSVRRAAADFVDKTLCFDGNATNQQVTQIQIKDSAYTDAQSFKQAMSGQYLYYELATYEETDIDIDLTYMIVSGGTEQLLPINTDVPVTSPMSRNVSFFYDSNVVSNLLTLLSSVAQVETSPTTHSYSVGDYLIYNYQLYRVNSAIAVGATLTVGTNITATTLVDIIKSL